MTPIEEAVERIKKSKDGCGQVVIIIQKRNIVRIKEETNYEVEVEQQSSLT